MKGINILYVIWGAYLFLTLGLTADAFFVPVLTKISSLLRLSETVAGVTLVAFGNGAPDIFAAIASYTATDPAVAKMAVGSLLGAGLFVVCVVGGACMLMTPFRPASWPLVRDIVGNHAVIRWRFRLGFGIQFTCGLFTGCLTVFIEEKLNFSIQLVFSFYILSTLPALSYGANTLTKKTISTSTLLH